MDYIGLATELVVLAKSLKDRYDLMHQNPGAADAQLKSYERMAHQLRLLTDVDRDTLNRFQPHHREDIQAELDSLTILVRDTITKLQHKIQKLESIPYAAAFAFRNDIKLAELQTKAAEATKAMRRIRDTVALAHRIDNIAPAEGRSGAGDVFRACFKAPRNPQRVTVDFDSKTSEGKPATCEGRLKAILLEGEASSSVGAIAEGMGGVGKTCALRALAADSDVIARFPGGIYFMSLGADADTARVIQELCDSVEAAGGKSLASGLRGENNLSRVIRRTSDWFAGRGCLFVFDDLWRSKDIGEDILVNLSELSSKNGDGEAASGLLYSTRDKRLSLQGAAVAFEAREPLGEVATHILMETAGADQAEARDAICEEAIKGVLAKCAGLPVTLNLCGTVVRQMRSGWDGDKRSVWNMLWGRLTAKDLIADSSDCYGPLEKGLQVSLDFLDSHPAASCARQPLSYHEMHRGLCVLKKQDWVPSSVLRWAWKLPDIECAETVMKWMGGVGVAHVEYRETKGGERMAGLRLHDLVHDFALREARRHQEELRWHAGLLDEYRQRYSYVLEDDERGALWPLHIDSAEDGGYMFRNVCRFLRGAKRCSEVGHLLHSARWVGKIFEMNSIVQYEQDVQMYSESAVADGGGLSAELQSGQDTELKESLRRVCKIARLCLPYCLVNVGEVWFQLYARLRATGRSSVWMQDMLAEIERHAPRPWLQVTGPCLKGADDSLVQVFPWGREIFSVGFVTGTATPFTNPTQKTSELMSIGGSGEGLAEVYVGRHTSTGESRTTKLVWDLLVDTAADVSQGETTQETEETRQIGRGGVRAWIEKVCSMLRSLCTEFEGSDVPNSRPGLESNEEQEQEQEDLSRTMPRCTSHDEVTCGAICEDGLRVVTGWDSGALRVSDSRTGELVWEQVDAHTDKVLDVAVTGDGARVVSGSGDGTVRFWDVSSAQQVCKPLIGHRGSVNSVAVNGDGTRLVSGSTDETVRLWDVSSAQQVGKPLTGHTGVVTSVAVSRDGTRAVSGSKDKTVRVWNLSVGQQLGEPYTGHTRWVTSVGMNKDGTRVVSGSDDRTVRVWDVSMQEQVGEPCTGHTRWLRSVGMSEDGSRVVSGSVDGTVRVWDVSSKQKAGKSYAGHTRHVTSVIMSRDGTRLVSGSADGTVRVWDVSSGEQVGGPFVGHMGWVTSVSVSSDGMRVLSGSRDGTVRVWDVSSGLQVGEAFSGHTDRVTSVDLSGDGTRAVSGSGDRTVRVWNVLGGRQVGEPFTGHTGWVIRVAVSDDGTRVVSGSYDETARVWDGTCGSCLHIVSDVHWEARWDILCQEYLEVTALGTLEPAENKRTSVVAVGSRVLHWRASKDTVLATFEEDIQQLRVNTPRGVVFAHLSSGPIVIARVVDRR